MFAAIQYDVWRVAVTSQRGLSVVSAAAIAIFLGENIVGTPLWRIEVGRGSVAYTARWPTTRVQRTGRRIAEPEDFLCSHGSLDQLNLVFNFGALGPFVSAVVCAPMFYKRDGVGALSRTLRFSALGTPSLLISFSPLIFQANSLLAYPLFAGHCICNGSTPHCGRRRFLRGSGDAGICHFFSGGFSSPRLLHWNFSSRSLLAQS